MSKRACRTPSAAAANKELCVITTVDSDFEFRIYYPKPKKGAPPKPNVVGTLLSEKDNLYVKQIAISFDPPIPEHVAALTRVEILHPRQTTIVFCMFPDNEGKKHVIDPQHMYMLFETHQLKLEEAPHDDDESIIVSSYSKMYILLENDLFNNKYELIKDLSHSFFPTLLGKRYVDLPFYPPDDPALVVKDIPQRTALWFKQRASSEMTGTRAYQYLGYYSDELLGRPKPPPINPLDLRMGTISEPIVIMNYLLHYTDNRKVFETGWVSFVGRPGWGASPDGIIELSNGQRGALEIKTSASNLNMEPYYIPQVYMEMLSLNVQWCHLIKYMRKSKDGAIEHHFRRYQIVRHKPTEQLLLGLWDNALKNKDKLGDVLASEPYVKVRRYMTALCDKFPYEDLQPNTDAIEKYNNFRYGTGVEAKRALLIRSIRDRSTSGEDVMSREMIQAQMESYRELMKLIM